MLHLEGVLQGVSAGLMKMAVLSGQYSAAPIGQGYFPGQCEGETKIDEIIASMGSGSPLRKGF